MGVESEIVGMWQTDTGPIQIHKFVGLFFTVRCRVWGWLHWKVGGGRSHHQSVESSAARLSRVTLRNRAIVPYSCYEFLPTRTNQPPLDFHGDSITCYKAWTDSHRLSGAFINMFLSLIAFLWFILRSRRTPFHPVMQETLALLSNPANFWTKRHLDSFPATQHTFPH